MEFNRGGINICQGGGGGRILRKSSYLISFPPIMDAIVFKECFRMDVSFRAVSHLPLFLKLTH